MKRSLAFVSKLIFQSIVVIFIGSCISESQSSKSHQNNKVCIGSEESLAAKVQLEKGIRGQVKFLDESEDLSSITNKLMDYNIPALSLAVINNGIIEWAETYKNPNFTEVQNLNCSSIFQTASLSKPVTFLAALRMHAAGEIDLDENIENYLKSYVLTQGKQTIENPVTFRNIFSHTSGINSGGYQGYARSLPMPTDRAILSGDPGVNSPAIQVVNVPNEVLAYSGGAYTLAELALQDIFSDKFSNIMKKWILEPAEMTNSEFTQPLPASRANNVAKAYKQTGEVIKGGWHNYPEQAAAGLWSNSIDMAKFMIEIYKAYQGQESIFSQTDIHSIISHERDGHVYGFILNRSGDDISITHYGGNAGYRTGMTISLRSGKGLVYLINSDNGGALGNELFLSASQVYQWKAFKQLDVRRKDISSEVLKSLSGKYKWNNQIDLSITFDENSQLISLFFPNGDEYKLSAIVGENLEFIHANTGVRVSFAQEDSYKSFTLYGQTAIKLK